VSFSFTRRRSAAILALPFLAACSTQATPPASLSSEPVAVSTASVTTAPATAATSASATSPAGTLVFRIAQGQSQAIFRVREQLVGRALPNDAVGTTSAVSGQLAIRPDGTVDGASSRITVDLNSLATDSSMRDGFIKQNTLQTSQYPTAEFVPTRVEGLPSPLPASGQYTFKLTGLQTIHGVQKEVTWDVTATRDGSALNGTATTAFTFGDFGMTPPSARSVLSVVDSIRLEVALAATQVGQAG
jgi:polyisoprenoid-binding protein YceI